MIKKVFKGLLFFLIICGIIVAAIFKVKQKKQELQKLKPVQTSPLPLEVAKIKKGVLPITQHYLAQINPVLSFLLSSKLSGFLVEMDKYEGDRVKKSEVVARIDARGIKEKIKAIEADIEGAKSDFITKKHIYERDKMLYENKAISREQYEVSKTGYDLSSARLKRLTHELRSLKVELSYAIITSPVDGVVLRRFHGPGDLVVPGIPIIEIEDFKKGYRIIVKVPEDIVSKLKKGSPVYIVEGEKRIEEKIYSIHPGASDGLGEVEIRTRKRPFGLPTYGKVGVDIVVSKVEGWILPLRGVLENVDTSYIFLARPIKGKDTAMVHIVAVDVLGRSKDRVVVRPKERLNTDDMVILADESTLLKLHEKEVILPEVIR